MFHCVNKIGRSWGAWKNQIEHPPVYLTDIVLYTMGYLWSEEGRVLGEIFGAL
jgi:hypothetical protein